MSDTEPPEKKPKKICTISNIYLDTIDKCIESISSSEKNLQPIISDELTQPLQFIDVIVGHIKNVKDISRTIMILNDKIPLKELSHLKRARRQDILLCPTKFLHNMSSIQDYIESHVTELKDVFDYFKELNVPLLPPKVTKQYKEIKNIWSCNFHPNRYFEKLVSNNYFSVYDVKIHRKFMEVAFEIAKWYAIQNGVPFDVTNILMTIVNITVVVDPNFNRIVTIACDYRHEHPMQHSAMLAIDNVAKTQNGGVWSAKSNDDFLPGIDRELVHLLKQKFSQFIIGLKKSNWQMAKGGQKIDSHGEKGDPKSHGENDEKDGPYLCTGYNVYMLREPCVMCAMALVHARAKRVFFCFNNSVCGALNSVVKLQTIPSLNHHFEVFTGFL